MKPWLPLVAAAALAAGVLGWRVLSQLRTAPDRATADSPVEMQVAGCAQVDAGGRCELPADRALRVWIGADDAASIALEADGVRLTSEAVAIDGGVRRRVLVPQGAHRLRAVGRSDAPCGEIALGDPVSRPTIERASSLRSRGERDAAQALLHERLPSLSPTERALALGILARIDLDRGAFEGAAAGLRASIEACRAAGLASQASYDSLALAFVLTLRLLRFDEALEVLDAAERAGLGGDEAAARLLHSRAQRELELGDYRAALAHLQGAEQRARRLELDRLWGLTLVDRAAALRALGRTEEALATLHTLLAHEESSPPDCDRANTLIAIGWVLFLSRESDKATLGTLPASEAPDAPLRRAEALFPAPCTDAFILANLETNLALVAVMNGQAAAARDRLQRARGALPERSAYLDLWWLDLEAGIARLEGDLSRALSLFREERRRAEVLASADVTWRATVGAAETLEQLGENSKAIDEYRRAEALRSDGSLDVPLGEGRVGFLADRERGVRGLVGLLVRSGRPEEAWKTARASRSTVLRALERNALLAGLDPEGRRRWTRAVGDYRRKREELAAGALRDWSLPGDELARAIDERRRDEAVLRAAIDAAYSSKIDRARGAPDGAPYEGLTLTYSATRDGWVGFGASGATVTARALGEAPGDRSPGALSDWLLAPFASELRSADRLRVLLPAALQAIDFHALPLDGAPLSARLPVEYPLDLPRTGAPAGARGPALVVSDPHLDLAAARAEGNEVAHALGATGNVRLLSGEDATLSAVTSALGEALAFHYAGHATFAGHDGWESALGLALGQQLDVSDALLLPSPPPLVVLASCAAARSPDEGSSSGLGIAQAFVLAGTRAVVAPTRAVDDGLAADFSRAFYAHLASTDEAGARVALRAAEEELRRKDQGGDWAAYRLIVR